MIRLFFRIARANEIYTQTMCVSHRNQSISKMQMKPKSNNVQFSTNICQPQKKAKLSKSQTFCEPQTKQISNKIHKRIVCCYTRPHEYVVFIRNANAIQTLQNKPKQNKIASRARGKNYKLAVQSNFTSHCISSIQTVLFNQLIHLI